jgi:hypothetical protein
LIFTLQKAALLYKKRVRARIFLYFNTRKMECQHQNWKFMYCLQINHISLSTLVERCRGVTKREMKRETKRDRVTFYSFIKAFRINRGISWQRINKKLMEEGIMVKGAQKQMVVVKITDSAVFEEAYFVLRRGAANQRLDMISEAERIVESSGIRRGKSHSRRPRAALLSALFFVLGAIAGALFVALLGLTA